LSRGGLGGFTAVARSGSRLGMLVMDKYL